MRSVVILTGPLDQPISACQKRYSRGRLKQKITAVEPTLCGHQSLIEINGYKRECEL